MEITNILYHFGPAIALATVSLALPLGIVLARCFCSWLDDGEKTFTYPSLGLMGPLLPLVGREVKRSWSERGEYGVSYEFTDNIFFCFLGGLVLVVWGRMTWEASLEINGFILSGLAVAYTFKKVFKLGKVFSKHVKDVNAHKG